MGLIGPDLQQFKRKLHKKRSPAGCWGRGLALAVGLIRRAGSDRSSHCSRCAACFQACRGWACALIVGALAAA